MTDSVKAVGTRQDRFAHLTLLIPALTRQLAQPGQQEKVMPNTGMKMMAMIQAIAVDGLRLAEIRTAATKTIRTWATNNSQLINTDCDIVSPQDALMIS